MKAAIIRSAGAAPEHGDFPDPAPGRDETLIEVHAAALHPVVRDMASGSHYASEGMLPMIPGIDGAGRRPDGTRVYFAGVRAPYGSMATYAAAPAGFTFPIPDGLDDVTAAGIMNPGMAAWLALSWRAELEPGQTVLVLGATGVSGRICTALARRLGAGRVIGAGRNASMLDRLDATGVVHLTGDQAADSAAIAAAAADTGIDVIIDYLWGRPAEAAIAAITRRGMTAAPRVRLVEVGQSAGSAITLPADVLRGSGLEIVGSGGGTVPIERVMTAIPEFLDMAAAGDLPIDIHEAPLSEAGARWHRDATGRRVVFRP